MPTDRSETNAAQIVVDPSRQVDGLMILATTAGHRLPQGRDFRL